MISALVVFALATAQPVWAAGAEPRDAIHLDVPVVRQEKELCGAASVAMVLKYWGRDISQYDVAAAVPRGAGGGIRGEDLRDYCVRAGFSAFLFRGDLAGLQAHLRKGRPIIVAIRSRSSGLYHYLVLVGFDDAASVVLANDPQRGELVRFGYKKFLAQWQRSRQWSLLVVPQAAAELTARARSLFAEEDYAGAETSLRLALELGPESAEVRYLLGMCAAFQGRLEDAERDLRAALGIDASFEAAHVEIGGLYFKQKKYAESERALRQALAIDPADAYARDLLGTVYFVNGVRDSALAQWNKLGKPVLGDLAIEGVGIRHPRLLQRELRVGPGRIIRPSRIKESLLRLDKVGCFASVTFAVRPRPDSSEQADLAIAGSEERGFGPSPAAAVLGGLRDVVHQTIYLDFKNIAHRGLNLHAGFRWDPAQTLRELTVSLPRVFGTPLFGRLSLRDRRDRWFFAPREGAADGSEFVLSGKEIRLDLDHVLSGRISLDHHARLRQVTSEAIMGAAPDNAGTRFVWGGDYAFRIADRPAPAVGAGLGFHYELSGSGAGGQKRFTRSVLTADLEKSWVPRLSVHESGRATARAAWGWASAGTPFDECFVLGIGPDVEYLLRAYRTSEGGRLGRGPVGRDFILMNVDYLRGLGRLALIDVDAGVFFDAGRIGRAPAPVPATEPAWLTDIGLCLEARVLRVGFRISYAHALAGRSQAVYLSATIE